MWVNFRCKFLAEVGQFYTRVNRRIAFRTSLQFRKWITMADSNGVKLILPRSMPQNRRKRLSANGAPRKPLSKTMLLPHTAAYVREVVLRNHLALAAFRCGQGNGERLAELVKALYVTWYLQETGYGALDHALYLEAERILDLAARSASRRIWLIEEKDCAPITRLLDLREQQLLSAPVHAVNEARARMVHFGRSDRRSPW
ncbi:hypothetical protein [Paraburkholderia graminis]|uniref:hypothetical protein n=1 Tax=Paraburkholderia graminis TaxID=60548 RepID=UPI00279229FE|nr:hypothetical protein [Paraburkholderia graminis]MDQ0621951.1 hypothetical protein [Paraburkholderia graminis]